MRERTEIDMQNLHFALMELAICKVYDDAKALLDELVTKEIGREYGDDYDFDKETGEWHCKEIKFKNSAKPNVVKLAVVDTMTSILDNHELISEEGTIAWEKSKVIDTAIMPFKRMDKELDRVRNWVQRWEKEPAPKTKKEITYRLIPKSEGVNGKTSLIFNYYVKCGNLLEKDRDTWDYVCGISDKDPKVPIVWYGEWPMLCTFIASFLENELYFYFKNGVRKHFICKVGEERFTQYGGNVLTAETLKGEIAQSKTNGTLKRYFSDLNAEVGINLTERLKEKLNL